MYGMTTIPREVESLFHYIQPPTTWSQRSFYCQVSIAYVLTMGFPSPLLFENELLVNRRYDRPNSRSNGGLDHQLVGRFRVPLPSQRMSYGRLEVAN